MNADRKVELLAPAGNPEGFYGAIHAGADAVYLGGRRFGARAYADNFTSKELIACIRYAHIYGRRVYLTVNTLVKEEEFSELYEYLTPFYEVGLDAVIVQDIGVFHYIRRCFPDLALHVSTQMTITGVHGAGLMENMGAVRVVPARELSLSEIMDIKRGTGLELECFVHGAMCYCYSGQCLFSSILGGRSGNRGRCAQPCRLPYMVKGAGRKTRECYPLSLKDMCTIEYLPELIEAGIDSFKIEGRMKRPEYTAGVTAVYRKYIDKYYDALEKGMADGGKRSFTIDKRDMEELSSLYIRSERQSGYYHKHNGRDMITLESPAYSKSDERMIAGIREKYLKRVPKIPVVMEARFLRGLPAQLTIALAGNSTMGTKTADRGIIGIEGKLSKTVSGAMVEAAMNQPVTEEFIKKQLCRLGNSCFFPEDIKVIMDESIFVPLKAVNELRREGVLAMEDALIEIRNVPGSKDTDKAVNTGMIMEFCKKAGEAVQTGDGFPQKGAMTAARNRLYISVQTTEQLQGLYSRINEAFFEEIDRIYVDGDLLAGSSFRQYQALDMCRLLAESCEVVIALPYILRASDAAYLESIYTLAENNFTVFSGFLVRCMEGMGYLIQKRYNGRIYTDAGFYLWNTEGIFCVQPFVSGICLPLELNGREQQKLLSLDIPCEKVVYGRIPMMITANCVEKTVAGCQKDRNAEGGTIQLIDRYKKHFPVYLNCAHCINIIYNSVPLSLHDYVAGRQNRAAMRLCFTMENSREMWDIITFFSKIRSAGNKAGGEPLPYRDYTTGHEKRGVE